jgi:Rps23 Pro-64 3,4-dihydroxylase Tpa1-like proline 4-hydroxylase
MFTRWFARRSGLVEPFNSAVLAGLGAAHDSYRTGKPFPHAIIDNLFQPGALDRVLAEWPQEDENAEHHDDGTYVVGKTGSTHKTRFGRYTQYLFHRLAEPQFLEALETLTGIQGLIPDPYLYGGGLHCTKAGGRLAVHADYNFHLKWGWGIDRRLNVLVYLNRNWSEANGGWLELWDKEMSKCVVRTLPLFNRTVVFSTTDDSYHGQPEPVVGPPSLERRSIALYYYTSGRPAEEKSDAHLTLWQSRPQGF